MTSTNIVHAPHASSNKQRGNKTQLKVRNEHDLTITDVPGDVSKTLNDEGCGDTTPWGPDPRPISPTSARSALEDMDCLQVAFEKYCTNGVVPGSQLISCVIACRTGAASQEIEQCVMQVMPDFAQEGFVANYGQLEMVYNMLLSTQDVDRAVDWDLERESDGKGNCLIDWVHRMWFACQLKCRSHASSSYGNQMKPTTRLLVVATVATLVIALAVTSCAVAFMWTDNIAFSKSRLEQTRKLVKDASTSFAYRRNNDMEAARLDFSTTLLGMAVQHIGYDGTLVQQRDKLLQPLKLLDQSIKGDFYSEIESLANSGARNIAVWIQMLVSVVSDLEVVRIANEHNQQSLVEGHELILARWADPTNSSIKVLTDYRYAAECQMVVCDASPIVHSVMGSALRGGHGSMIGFDYRQKRVQAAYLNVHPLGWGIVYTINFESLLSEFRNRLLRVVESYNNDTTMHQEMMVAQGSADGRIDFMNKPRHSCGGKPCALHDWNASAMHQAVNGSWGVLDDEDYRGKPVVAAYGYFAVLHVGVLLQADKNQLLRDFFTDLIRAFNAMNPLIAATEELVLAFPGNKSQERVVMPLTKRFGDECGNNSLCAWNLSTALYYERVIYERKSGIDQGLDYRGAPVKAGYWPVPGMDLAVVIEVDQAQIDRTGLMLMKQYAEEQNEFYTDSSEELMLGSTIRMTAMGRVNSGYEIVTKFKFDDACEGAKAAAQCDKKQDYMVNALAGERGMIDSVDYRGYTVLAAYDYFKELDMGLVVKLDMGEVIGPAMRTAGKLIGVSMGYDCLLALLFQP